MSRYWTLLLTLSLTVYVTSCQAKLRVITKNSAQVSTPVPALPVIPPKIGVIEVELNKPKSLEVSGNELNFDVKNSNIVAYRYAIVFGTDCMNAVYGAWRSPEQPLQDKVLKSGDYVVCLLGKDKDGLEQVDPTIYRVRIFVTQPVALLESKTLSETSVRVTWVKNLGKVKSHDIFISDSPDKEPDLKGKPFLSGISGEVDSTEVSNLGHGSTGKILVRASLDVGTSLSAPVTDPSKKFWTPFGAVNSDSVNAVRPIMGHAGGSYAGAVFVSEKFSYFHHGFYWPEFTEVFKGIPSLLNRPTFNLTRFYNYNSGFKFANNVDVYQVWSDGEAKFLVTENNRVLVYNHLPLTPELGAPDFILGQTDLTTVTLNGGGTVSSVGMNTPGGVCWNGATLYVSDSNNHRILGWNGWPHMTGQPADFVLGQSSFTANAANAGGMGIGTFNTPLGINCDHGFLAVADALNNRVLVWNSAPTSNVAANLVLGQSTGVAFAANGAGGANSGGLNIPHSVISMSNGSGDYALLVSDSLNHRIVQWDVLPTTNGQAFSRVYGQPSRSSVAPNAGGSMGVATLNFPFSMSVDHQGKFWVGDFNNGRWLRFNLNMTNSPADGPDAIGLHGLQDFTSPSYLYGSFSANRYGVHVYSNTGFIDPNSGLFSPSGGSFFNEAPVDGTTPFSAVYGQPTPESSLVAQPTTATSVTSNVWDIGNTSAVKIGGRVFWSDMNGKRILSKVGLFNSTPEAPDVILGNKTFTGGVAAAPNEDWAHKLIYPTQLGTDGARFHEIDPVDFTGLTPS